MFIYAILFLSLLVIISLFGIRIVEIRKGRRLIISERITSLDPFFIRLRFDAEHAVSVARNSIYHFPETARGALDRAMHAILSKLQGRIRRREMQKDLKPSAHLERLNVDKKLEEEQKQG